MREISFRGKRMHNGKWVEGCLQIWSDSSCGIQPPTLLEPEYAVDPSTVGEFTGLYDKNGKRIFEGDIVEGLDFSTDDDGYGVVTWDDGGFLVINAFISGSFVENYAGRDFEVVGNIHDNPELIGGE